jgi:hypothetical protein
MRSATAVLTLEETGELYMGISTMQILRLFNDVKIKKESRKRNILYIWI